MQSEELTNYINRNTTGSTEVLKQLQRETYLKVFHPQMISGPYQGRLLTMLTQMIQPKRVLEIGTFTGYIAICMAMGLPENGLVHTIEIKEELEDMIRKYLKLASVENQVKLHIGDAKLVIPTLEDRFDLVFIDAKKMDYEAYYDLIFPKVNIGGYILTDNVLWYGKVLDEEKHANDKRTVALNAFNKKIQADDRVENILLPIRDGIMIARKIL